MLWPTTPRSIEVFVHMDEGKAAWKAGVLTAESCLRHVEAVDVHAALPSFRFSSRNQ